MTTSLVRRAATALSPLVFLIASTAPVYAGEAPAKAATSAATNPQDAAAKAWNFAASDVPVDPNIVFGVLPNGMKYALLKNSTPKDSVVLRMRFAVGSFAEAEDQRGLAHFLEHMAFNGSKGVPEGEMIKLLERKGLAFGADTNASTGFDETVYKLDLPNASDDLIEFSRRRKSDLALSNVELVHNAVDWVLADTDLLAIRAHTQAARALTIDPDTHSDWRVANIVIAAVALALVVVLAWLRRRAVRPFVAAKEV